MFAKRLLQKAAHHHHHQHDEQPEILKGSLQAADIGPRIISHYGVPSTASILAVDSVQQLIAIGTLDGRIKVIGGHNIESLFISPKLLPYKYLEFLENQGFLVGITQSNEIQVWNLESQYIDSCLQWESSITAFSVINGSPFMVILDEHELISVLKYIAEDRIMCMPYNISAMSIAEKAGFSFSDDQHIVGLLPQPRSFGNRILIAYEIGLLILWDIAEAEAICVRGDKDLEMKAQLSDFSVNSDADPSEGMVHNLDEKEISTVCWASSSGHILAVGYIDGDILLWDMATKVSAKSLHNKKSQNDIVKLQLSSAEKRFPIITLHWASSSASEENDDGLLFIYGGVEIGSEEVVTVVNLQWSSGAQNLTHVYRTDLSLTGSFSDMVLHSSFGMTGCNSTSGLFILSNPGKLQFFDKNSLSASTSQLERTPLVPIIESPLVMHPSEPHITATKLTFLYPGLDLSMIASMDSNIHSDEVGDWPLNGGIPIFVPSAEEKQIEKVYLTGHQDGSVRLYDASCTMLHLVSILENQANDIEISGSNAPISTIDLCVLTMDLAVGNESGLVYVYSLRNDADGTKIHVIDNSKLEVHEAPQRNRAHCKAIVRLVSSPIVVLQFSESGTKLAMGYKSNHVAVLDVTSFRVLFLLDSLPESRGPVDFISWKTFRNSYGVVKEQKHSAVEAPGHPPEEMIFSLTSDGKFNIIDGNTGNAVSSQPMHVKSEVKAISMYVLEGNSAVLVSSVDRQSGELVKEIENESEGSSKSGKPLVTGNHSYSDGRLLDSLVLICFENSLHLCAVKSAFQGKDKPIRKVQLQNPCCWTATFNKHDKLCGMVLLYQTGMLEVRSLPDLEVVAESSLMSILRWNFRPKMEKIISSTENGQIILVNGYELAFISLSADEDYFRAVKALPCLHDQVLASAAEAAISHMLHQKKQAGFPRLVAGFKKNKPIYVKDSDFSSNSKLTHLEAIFSRGPVAGKPSSSRSEDIEELDIDDIVIDDPVPIALTSSLPHKPEGKAAKGKGAETDRHRLFEGASVDTNPKTRTVEEIKAKYRKDAGDAASGAELARDKLLERQEKLERLSKRTEDLRDGAEDFSSMASELARNMQARKWWQI